MTTGTGKPCAKTRAARNGITQPASRHHTSTYPRRGTRTHGRDIA